VSGELSRLHEALRSNVPAQPLPGQPPLAGWELAGAWALDESGTLLSRRGGGAWQPAEQLGRTDEQVRTAIEHARRRYALPDAAPAAANRTSERVKLLAALAAAVWLTVLISWFARGMPDDVLVLVPPLL
jgi:hypothetical protein